MNGRSDAILSVAQDFLAGGGEAGELIRSKVHVRSVEGQGSTFTVAIPTGHAHLPKERLAGTRSPTFTGLGAMPFVEEALHWSSPGASFSFSTEPSLEISSTTSSAPAHLTRILFADDNADLRDYVRYAFLPLQPCQGAQEASP